MECVEFTLGGETPVVEAPCLQVGRILFRPLSVIDLSASAGLPHETGKIVPADVIADFFKPWDAAFRACESCRGRLPATGNSKNKAAGVQEEKGFIEHSCHEKAMFRIRFYNKQVFSLR